MKKIFLLVISAFILLTGYGQHTFIAIIKNSVTKEPVANVTVTLLNLKKTYTSNNIGLIRVNDIPDGKQAISFSHTSYEKLTDSFNFPLATTDTVEILLKIEQEALDEVVVQSTKTGRTIKNNPTRVETIDAEELDEKNNMRPANVSMLLHESTGLQVQQTSAVSANASIRVQGLDGRYTQLLKDGYPNFGNFASGLSILEIPPLDLKQVEVIKGPASTLYGAGAIAGVVNFISKTPKEKREYNFIINQSNIGQTNVGTFLSHKKGKFGYTFLGLVNFQKAYDADKDEFSELPRSTSFTINPQLFYYPNATTTLLIGNSFTKGNNKGGDMLVIKGRADSNHVYFEENLTTRNTTVIEFDKKYHNRKNFKIKQSLSFFQREINIPTYHFSGLNTNSFTDISYVFHKKEHTIISGINFLYDRFKQKMASADTNQDTRSFTSGVYVQDSWDISDHIKMESGIRFDQVRYSNMNYSKSQSFILPRISALFKLSNKISSRIGGGLGYKIPTIFTEQTESIQYRHVAALNDVTSEKSIGFTADINLKTKLGTDLSISINQLFFFTSIHNPLVLQTNLAGNYYFSNASKNTYSKGFETNLKFIYKEDLKLLAGYTFTYAKAGYLTGNQLLPLLPRNKLNLTLVYEKEQNFKIGLEGYFTDQQYLYNGSKTPSYWEFGAMAEKTMRKISLFINFENFTDQRQSNYKTVVNPPHANPVFDDIWNHTEGFVVNGGIKIKL